MLAGTTTTRRSVLRSWVMPAVLISLAAGLGSVVPAPQAAAHTSSVGSFFSGRPLRKGTAYVTNSGSDTVRAMQNPPLLANGPLSGTSR